MSGAVAEKQTNSNKKPPHRFSATNQPANKGRKAGVPSKYSPAALMAAIEATVGKPFVQSMAEAYLDSINSGDTKLRWAYEKMILDKVVADKVEVTTDGASTLEDRMAAFHRALGQANNAATVPLTVEAIVAPTITATIENSNLPSNGQ